MENMVRGWPVRTCSTLEWMQTGKASKTALRVAIRRAAHQVIDNPRVLDDPIAVRLLGPGFARDMERAMHPVARDFRAFMAARSRYVEDQLAKAVANGVDTVCGSRRRAGYFRISQSVSRLCGYSRSTFPQPRSGSGGCCKRRVLPRPPASPLFHWILSTRRWPTGLRRRGSATIVAAFFGWLGVVPYLTLDAFRSTLNAVARLPAGTGISFDYAFAPETLSPQRRLIFEALSARVAAAGEPFKLFFTPEQMEVGASPRRIQATLSSRIPAN